MSVKERDCLKIVSQLAGPGGGAGKLTQAQAAVNCWPARALVELL